MAVARARRRSLLGRLQLRTLLLKGPSYLRRTRSPARRRTRPHPPRTGTSAAVAPAPIAAAGTAVRELAPESVRELLELAQRRRIPELDARLSEAGFLFRLATPILSYPTEYNGLRAAAAGNTRHAGADGRVCVLDSALDERFIASMRGALGPEAPFWTETGYLAGDVGYFSFVHRLGAEAQGHGGAGAAGFSVMDQLISAIRALMAARFPALAEAQYAEWWAHNRAHEHSHQLHFDSADEGAGGVRNPIISTVLFLEAAGGPTLVTAQARDSTALAQHGWLAYPRVNRLVAFDGSLLHCVVPGRATQRSERRRVTVMVSFWRRLDVRDEHRAGDHLGPAKVLPPPSAPHAPRWCKTFAPAPGAGVPSSWASAQARSGPVVPVEPVWEPVGRAEREAAPTPATAATVRQLPPYEALFQGC